MRRSTALMLTLTIAACGFGGFHWDRAERQASARAVAERELGQLQDDFGHADDVAQVTRHAIVFCREQRSDEGALLVLFKRGKPPQFRGACKKDTEA